MTSQSEMLFDRAKKVIPGGVHSPVRAFYGVGGNPRFIKKAKGAILTDVDGKDYTDFCMSWGPMILGHADEDVADAVHEALGQGWTFGACENGSLELCEFITQKLPWIEKIRLVNSGTEAVMTAIRLARAVTGRDKILKFSGCYHGHSDALLVRAGSGLAQMPVSDSAGVTRETATNTIVVSLDDLKGFENVIEDHKNQIAAVILEPIPANHGLLIPKENFLNEVSRQAKRAGILVIYDEVITGFRLGFTGMAGVATIKPDLITYGKIIGGGFPVGAIGGRTAIMDLLAPLGPVYQAGTLSANPVAVAAGLATLKKIFHQDPYAKLDKLMMELTDSLTQTAKSVADIPVQVQSVGSMFWLVFGAVATTDGVVRNIEQIPPVHRSIFSTIFNSLLNSGIYLAPSAFEIGFLSTAHTSHDIAKFNSALGTALEKVRV